MQGKPRLSRRYNMDTNRMEVRFEDGTTLAIDCIAVEDEYGSKKEATIRVTSEKHDMPFLPCKLDRLFDLRCFHDKFHVAGHSIGKPGKGLVGFSRLLHGF